MDWVVVDILKCFYVMIGMVGLVLLVFLVVMLNNFSI